MRKLVSIQKINSISEIPGADNIVTIGVLGWKLVTQRSNNLKVGDTIVYFEIDSFIPEMPFFEFLRPSSFRTHADGTTGYKIRTAKFRGQVSQGFALPISTLVNELNCTIQLLDGVEVLRNINGKFYSLEEGTDITEMFGVIKFEAPIPTNLAGMVEGEIPGFLKTDEIRCLSGDSIITTEIGPLTIQYICENNLVGIKVLTYNIFTGKNEWNKIEKVNIDDNDEDWYKINTEKNNLISTSTHPFYLSNYNCYRKVNDLILGDELFEN